MNASDTDNSNSELLYTILNQPDSSGIGYIAKLETPNVPITLFTQEEIDQGKIVYVHYGNTTGEDKIALQVRGMFGKIVIHLLRDEIAQIKILYVIIRVGFGRDTVQLAFVPSTVHLRAAAASR